MFPDSPKRRTHTIRNREECWRRVYFNGLGELNREWVTRLEELTRIVGLGSLTMGFLRDKITTHDLVCKKPRWCPACFREDAEGGIPYGRLIWNFNAVTCCPKHRIRLVERCDCNVKDVRREKLTAKCLPSICLKCSCFLGISSGTKEDEATPAELRQAGLVADLLTSDFAQGGQLAVRDVAHFLGDSVTKFAEGKSARFARLIGVGASSMHGWIHRDHIPCFSQILRIAEVHGCSIADVLCGNSDAVTRNPLVLNSERGHGIRTGSTRSPRRDLDWGTVAVRLNEMILDGHPITIVEAGRRLGIRPDLLRQRRPSECSIISFRWKEWRAANAKVRQAELEEIIHETARGLVEQGIRPTWRRVADAVFPSRQGYWGTPRLHEICKAVQLESKLK